MIRDRVLTACLDVAASHMPLLAGAHDPAIADVEEASGPSSRALAQQDQNPITRFYVVRLENDPQLGFGPNDEALNFFRFQPLVPFELTSDWTLLTRIVVPVASISPGPSPTTGWATSR